MHLTPHFSPKRILGFEMSELNSKELRIEMNDFIEVLLRICTDLTFDF